MERRKFTRELKLEAVKLVTERGVTVAQAGRDLGVHGTVLWRWIKAAAVDLQQAFPWEWSLWVDCVEKVPGEQFGTLSAQ
jgi:transposase